VLGDALTRASEHKPELIIDFATLTGAARVALGPTFAFLFILTTMRWRRKSSKDPEQQAIPCGGCRCRAGYEAGLRSPIADMKIWRRSSGRRRFFYKAFVNAPSWAHFDIWAWRPARYGRPAGAAACGLRAVWAMLKKRYV